MQRPLDVWDAGSFDPPLMALLRDGADLIQSYFETDHRLFLHERRHGGDLRYKKPSNPHAAAFIAFWERLGDEIGDRTIRAFHYTRLTDGEVKSITRDGIHLSSPASLRRRLEDRIAEGLLTREHADSLLAASPFAGDQLELRTDRFWMISHPTIISNSGVAPLMAHWGGEVTHFWMEDAELLARLSVIGKPRVIEVAVPLGQTRHKRSAATAVIAAFGRSIGCIPEKGDFDLYVAAALPPDAILAIHTEGEPTFAEMGQKYPPGFVDVGIGRWKELTGEDD
ncbi:hypothetical protein [Neoroseomonas lacus]|uniref:Uncharacterized protein n=1 Tax=Neoroseomonas lacus TaxID=287609 RepID=A0A917KUI3_9PROT|nr:hypothetical protein [Neoroseomonas lacus]GGJ25287.1 hypothetical protein GCM10011320_35830 [Neoroseomonas lacus]